MQDGRKAVWSIPYVSVAAFFPSLKQNFIAYRSSKVSSRPDCIFEIHQLWQSGFSRGYSNCCCNCSFEPVIIRIGQSSHKMYSNNILKFQESTIILNACTKKSGNLLKAPRNYRKKWIKSFRLNYTCTGWIGLSSRYFRLFQLTQPFHKASLYSPFLTPILRTPVPLNPSPHTFPLTPFPYTCLHTHFCTYIHVLDEVLRVSLHANSLEKGINPFLLLLSGMYN